MTGTSLVALVGLAAILASGVADANSPGAAARGAKCAPIADEPLGDALPGPRLVKTDDNQLLVGATSYLILRDAPEPKYLPLVLQSLARNTELRPDARNVTLLLGFDCARIDILLSQDSSRASWTISSIKANLSGDKKALACSKQNVGITYPSNQRFSCLDRLAFSCEADDGSGAKSAAADIVFANGLEIELGGDPQRIAASKFSLKPYVSSCPK